MSKQSRYGVLVMLLVGVLPVLSCNNNLDNGGGAARPLPQPVSAKALSRHYVAVKLDTKSNPANARAEDFLIKTSDQTASLQVLDIQPANEDQTIVLVTEAQENRGYTLNVVQTDGMVSAVQNVAFAGSSLEEPRLLSAVALSSTSVLLTFSEPMNPVTAEIAAFYHIVDPDGDPDVDISVTAADVQADGSSVLLTTTPQDNLQYTIQVANVNAAYVASSICLGDEYLLKDAAGRCAAQIRPMDTNGAAAPFALTGRTLININAPLDPNAAGSAGTVYFHAAGAGVKSAACGGDQSINGLLAAERDEELIFTFDYPVQHEAITIGHWDFTLNTDDPVYFLSSDSSADFDIVANEASIAPAFTQTDFGVGRVYLGDVSAISEGALVDALKIRETNSSMSVAYLCIAASRRIDPNFAQATFYGIPPVDNAPPTVVSAVATSNTSVLVSFSEPLRAEAADSLNFAIESVVSPPAMAENVVVTAAEPTRFNTQVILTTLPLIAGQTYEVTVSNVMDAAGNEIGTSNNSAQFAFQGGSGVDPNDLPRVAGAISTGNRSVVVSFTKPMGDSALVPSNYFIIQLNQQPEAGYLGVTDAAFDGGDRTAVKLTTLSQSELTYFLRVVNVKDLLGNPLAPPELLVDPATAIFPGTPASCVSYCASGAANAGEVCYSDDDCDSNPPCTSGESDCEGKCELSCEAEDSDGDGLSDAEEQRGWQVLVELMTRRGEHDDREITRRDVTSNPFSADTDDDGLDDYLEKQLGTDPRDKDSDDDLVLDEREYNLHYTNPVDQDSDDDEIDDYLETALFFTSPIMADTDGDQMIDSEELYERSRNPLIADLPLPQITVDEIVLELNITSSFTDEEGTTQSTSTTSSTTFTDSRTSSLGTSSTDSTESENKFGVKIGAEGGSSGWKVSGETSFETAQSQGYSTTINAENSQTSQQEYQESITEGLEFSQSRSVTRNIDSAIVQTTVNISNKSDIAFSITNIELSLLQQDRVTGLTFRPIATLRPTAASDPLGQPVYNIGPLEQDRGPIIFENVSIFPNRAEALMREPTGLVAKVVNFDVTDELGRNLVFTTQEVTDKTVALTIDFGDGRVELYRIATANDFDENALPAGITMERALEIAGLTHAAAASTDPNTYATVIDTRDPDDMGPLPSFDVEALVRVRDVSNSNDGKKFWTAVSSNTGLDENADFRTIRLFAHDAYLVMYTSDVDEDELFLREEYLYGSSDEDTDSDDDSLGDFFEVRTGWTVSKLPGLPYKTFPSPARPDSDLDDLRDDEELAALTDPNRADTDEDGRSDASELLDTYTILLFDGDDDITNDKVLEVAPYSDWAIIAGADGVCDTTTASGGDTVVTQNGTGSKLCIASGPNGVIDTTKADDDQIVATAKIDAGPDGICDTTSKATGSDDVVESASVISAGPDGVCDTTVATGDDTVITMVFTDLILCIGAGSNGTVNTTPLDDDQTISVPFVDPAHKGVLGPVCISAGADGEIQTDPLGDDFLRVAHAGLFGTDPVNHDTDTDGINDGREVILGINPNSQDAGKVVDTDADGLFDDEEDFGWLLAGTTTRVFSDKNLADSDRDGIPDVLERAIQSHPKDTNTDSDSILDYLEFDSSNPTVRRFDSGTSTIITEPLYDPVALADALTRCGDADNCSYTAPHASLLASTHPAKSDTDGDTRNDDTEINVPCMFTVYGGSEQSEFSHPLYAESEVSVGEPADNRHDGLECVTGPTPAPSNPLDPDTDDDLRNDGAEIAATLNPLRPDKRITVTMDSIYVNDDCDSDTLRGLELEGDLYIDYPPSSGLANGTFRSYGCTSEEAACEHQGVAGGCCCMYCDSTETACTTESYSVNVTSAEFILQQDEGFRLTSNQLKDTDGACDAAHASNDVGSPVDHSVSYSNTLSTPIAIEVGSGSCMITLNYTINIVN